MVCGLISIPFAFLYGIIKGVKYERARVGGSISSLVSQHPKTNSSKIGQIVDLVNERYIDPIPADTLNEEIIPKIMEMLDPHSVYIPAKEMSALNEPLEGAFEGVGIVFNMAPDTIIVMSVVDNGPSAKAGVIARDRIININGNSVAGQKIPQDSIMRLLRGKGGTTVQLDLERGGAEELINVEVTRGKIPVYSIPSAFMITDSIAFVKISQFSRTTHAELSAHLAKLKEQGMKSLILDFRGNSGGYMDQATMVVNEFLPSKQLVVYTEDRLGNQMREWSNGEGKYVDLPLVVLIDEVSASASEIVAGAIQDNDRGTIVGRRSFGKGLVQQQIPFNDGSAVRLTIARYYTPLGRSIQRSYKRGEDEQYYNRLERIMQTQLSDSAYSALVGDTTKYVTPGGRTLYGGGGITPDDYVKPDSITLTQFYRDVMLRNILFQYTIDYSDKHAVELSKIRNINDLNALLGSDGALLSDFVKYAASKGVRASSKDLATSGSLLDTQLRAYIGRNSAMGDNGFYASSQHIDNALRRAIELLE